MSLIPNYILGPNTILALTFWGHSQFSLYILVVINLVSAIFNLQINLVSIVNSLTKNAYVAK